MHMQYSNSRDTYVIAARLLFPLLPIPRVQWLVVFHAFDLVGLLLLSEEFFVHLNHQMSASMGKTRKSATPYPHAICAVRFAERKKGAKAVPDEPIA